MQSFAVTWLEVLQEHERMYDCTDAALRIDLDYMEDKVSQKVKVFLTLIMVANGFMVIASGLNFTGHYLMMMEWYQENPKDGFKIARNIKVGLRVEEDRRGVEADTAIGQIIPEADREVNAKSSSFALSQTVTALPMGKKSQPKFDISESSPKLLANHIERVVLAKNWGED